MFGLAETIWRIQNVERNEASLLRTLAVGLAILALAFLPLKLRA